MVSALNRKLLRDLRSQAAQVATIALVIGSGIASYVAMRGTFVSLDTSRDRYYQAFRFADVFAHLSRAPDPVAAQLEEVPGVAVVETRLLEPIRVPMPGMLDPARGYVVTLPDGGEPRLNAIWVREGRTIDPERDDEAVLLYAFAEAHDVGPGDTIEVVMNGRLDQVRIVGVADSPEFAFAAVPGEILADPERFAVLWMSEDAVEAAFDLDGAFDDVLIRLQPDTDPRPVLGAVDAVLAPWGGAGALAREDQPSNELLEQEMGSLRVLATAIPVVFLGVAAFLLQVVLGRLVQLQRTQIATLKAFGYTRAEIGLHYLGFVSAVGLLGAAIGLGLGSWFGTAMTALYAGLFHLPAFAFRPTVGLVATSIAVGLVASIAGAARTVLSVVAMPPAEAMRPPSPPAYTRGWLDELGLLRLLAPATRMMVRDLLRRPLRLLASVLGIAFATGVVVVGRFSEDAVDVFDDVLFSNVQADDVSVTFVDPIRVDDLSYLRALPGVRYVEGQRAEAARFSNDHVRRDGLLIAYPETPRLRRLLEWPLQRVPIPEHGVALTDVLAEILRVRPGDTVHLEMLFDEHVEAELVVVRLVDEVLGLQGHVSQRTFARMLQEPVLVNQAFLTVDPPYEAELVDRLTEIPAVLGITRKSSVRAQFAEQTAQSRGVFTLIATGFGAAMAIGVVYNNARVTLSSRSRELASLRVLGFTRREVAAIVLGEQGIQVALGVPLGLLLGWYLAGLLMGMADPESWRFPVIIAARTYAFAVVVVVAAAIACGALVARRVEHLDLVGVLKTRE